jgi:hypothetical protein
LSHFPALSAALLGGWMIAAGQTANPKSADPAIASLAQRMDAASSDQERDSLLSANPALATDVARALCPPRRTHAGALGVHAARDVAEASAPARVGGFSVVTLGL